MQAVRSPRQTVEQFLRATISGRPGDIADCYAPEVVIEMPFAIQALYPARTEATRESLRGRFDAGASVRRYTGLSDVAIHETGDPEVIVAEYTLHGEMTATAEPFAVRFAMVITVRDGYIVHSRDYTDPVAAARLLGKVPELIATLTASGA
jgi:uncharacterized protein